MKQSAHSRMEERNPMKIHDLISPEQVLPLILIIINLLAAIVCFVHGEPKKGVYWIAAAVLNYTVTF